MNYTERLLNVENQWGGEVDCPEVMGPWCYQCLLDTRGCGVTHC